jgi:cytochrome c biogenesis protein CcmG, thiol:disulfide interchange protein DsbE
VRGAQAAAVLLGLLAVLAACGDTPAGDAGGGGGAADVSSGSGGGSAAGDASAGEGSGGGAAADLPPCPPSRDVAARPDGLPDLTLDCLGDGPPVTLSGLRGKPTVVNVWASWCPPCAREMPLLEKVRRQTAGDVRFLGVDLLDAPGPARAAAADFGMGFPSVQDPDGESRQALGVPGPPVTLFVDGQGRVVHTEVGEITSAGALRGLVAEHLGVTP